MMEKTGSQELTTVDEIRSEIFIHSMHYTLQDKLMGTL